MTPRHYSKAPIIEAAIDLKCEYSASPTIDTLERIREGLSVDYPIREELVGLLAQIGAGTGVTTSQKIAGIRALTSARSKIAGLGLDGFTFSWLAPYDRWESLRDEAFRTWTLYASITKPVRILRVGVRFVNRLDLPNPGGRGVDLDRYLRTAPKIAPELPQQLESFFMRFQMLVTGDPPARVTITETAVGPARPDVISILLDIDAFVQGLNVSGAGAWEIVERLRGDKNLAFESSITDATRELLL